MKYPLLISGFVATLFAPDISTAQTVYAEDFDGASTWTLNTVLPAPEGSNPNFWFVSCEEEGVGSGFCGEACGTGDKTLHISWDPALGGDLGALYFETGFGFTNTHRRANSPNINTVGYSGMTLSFDIIAWGGNASDFAQLVYSIDGGTIWTPLAMSLTTLCCGSIPCTGADQGLWQTNTYLLPGSCEGIPNLKIGFVWNNTDDGIATDPSVAIDNLSITISLTADPPVALFSPEDNTVCEGTDVTYTDLSSTDDVISSWLWTFDGGVPSSATGAGPHTVNYSVPGVYTTTLEVTDGIGTHDTSFTITVEDLLSPGSDAMHDFCSSDSPADLFVDLGSADPGGTWSPPMTSGTGVFDPSVDPALTYTYTIVGVACPIQSAEVMAMVMMAANAGLDNTLNICSSDDSVDLFPLISPADPGGFWVPTLAGGSGYFDPILDGSGLYTYVVIGSGLCPNDSSELDVLVVTAVYAGSDASHAFCATDGPADLFIDLPGADAGGIWSPALTSGTGVFDPAADVTGTYTYTVDGISPCPDDNAIVTVVIDAIPNAGTDGSHDFCSNDPTYDLFADLGFADVGGSWSPSLTSGTGLYDPAVDPAGSYVYTLDGGGCPDDFATIIVATTVFLSAGADSVYTTCESQGTFDLNDLLSMDASGGGTWTDDDATGSLAGSIFDFSLVAFPGTYHFTYHQTNTAPCVDDSALFTFQMIDCTGLEETGTAEPLTIYPNPTSGQLTILSGGKKISEVRIFTPDGKLILATTGHEINVSHLAIGIYVVRVSCDAQVYQLRLVKE